jgi:UDP-2,3-diacylglucosamine pyrophosphatase LpxH
MHFAFGDEISGELTFCFWVVLFMFDAIILSDIHLGSGNCQTWNVCRLLERIIEGDIVTSRLILNGDVFDSMDFRRLNRDHWRVLALIRKLSDRIDVISLCGNHDGSAEILLHLLGVTVLNDYVLESGSERILILHGHVFDTFLASHPILTWLADCGYAFLQWMDRTHHLARLVKHSSKTFLRCAKKIEDEAVELARRRGCNTVCCGHTHSAVAHTERLVAYYNCGCWTELPCTYLTVAGGIVRLRTFHPEMNGSEEHHWPRSRLAG